MVVRIVQFLLGAGLAGGGGYLGWLNRGLAVSLFPADAGTAPWLLIGALLAVCIGVVLLVASVLPQRAREAQVAAEIARREESLQAADTFYGERSRAADRDWRSGDLPPEPVATPQPVATPKPVQAKPAPAAPPKPANAGNGPFPAAAALAPIPVASDPPLQPLPASTPAPAPVESKPSSPAEEATPAPVAKPALAPIASSAPVSVTPAPAVIAAPPANGTFSSIRDAISGNRLDEADKLLADERTRAGTDGPMLAELTGLAGDHAAAAGRPGNAKWLWRLALKRFADAGEINSGAARDVSERLRLIDQ